MFSKPLEWKTLHVAVGCLDRTIVVFLAVCFDDKIVSRPFEWQKLHADVGCLDRIVVASLLNLFHTMT